MKMCAKLRLRQACAYKYSDLNGQKGNRMKQDYNGNG